MKSIDHAILMNEAYAASAMELTLRRAPMAEERLPFTVRVVRSEEALHKAVAIRQSAYARHVPELAAKLSAPEPHDHDEGSVVLLAESKLDGSAMGTMRIQTNRFKDLAVAKSVDLPAWLKGKRMAEATRLGVGLGRTGRLVKTVLFKALYLYCVEEGIEWIVIGARSPLDKQYEALLFQDLYPGQFIPLRHAGDIPHRVLAFEVETAEKKWVEANHPLYKFMAQTRHPDIELGGTDYCVQNIPLRTAELFARVARAA